MKTKTFDIAELNEAKYNPRKMMQSKSKQYENLKKSLKKFGVVVPIIVNERNNTVVGGHQRLNALKELGYKEVEAVTVDLGEKAEKQLNIALNKVEGRWDVQKLEELIESMTDKELEFTGFADKELETERQPGTGTPAKESRKPGFEVYISFDTRKRANEWLAEHGLAVMSEGEDAIVIDMEER